MGAANILRFGLVATRAGATREYWQELPRDERGYYTSHPYGHPLLLAATYALFGVKERVGRSLSLAFCLALLWLLFVFGRRSQASIGGLAAAATAASLPMMHEYGPMVIGQIPSLPFVVTLYLLYFRILQTGTLSVGIAAATVLSILAAGLLDWHVFFHLPVLGIHFASRAEVRGRLRARVSFTLALAGSLPIFLFLAHTYWLDGFQYLFRKALQRTGVEPAVRFGWLEFVARQADYLASLYRPAAFLVAVVGLALPPAGPAAGVTLAGRLSAAAALLETGVFSEAMYIHDYFTFVWILPVSWGVASVLERSSAAGNRLPCVAVATVLLASLFASAFRQVRAHVESSAEQSLPLIKVVHSLSSRMAPGEKLVVYGRPTQFERQIKYYLRHEHFYVRRAFEATAIARRCGQCRFLVLKDRDRRVPDAGFVRDVLRARYPHELAHGYYIFALAGREEPAPAGGG